MPHGDRRIEHQGIEVVYLGAKADAIAGIKTKAAWEGSDDREHWEGIVTEMPVDDETLLREFSTNYKNWFPTGIAHHLIWLATRVPNASFPANRNANDLLIEILDGLEAKMK